VTKCGRIMVSFLNEKEQEILKYLKLHIFVTKFCLYDKFQILTAAYEKHHGRHSTQ